MRDWLQKHTPKIVLMPSIVAIAFFVYGFMVWTFYVSLTKSRLLPRYDLIGFVQYDKMFSTPRWDVAISNLVVFGASYILFSIVIGLALAIFLDQRIRMEGFIRTIYFYPMALSFIVTGTAWRWILNPGLGIEKTVRDLGWETFTFDWLVDPEMAIYTIVIAAVWQSSGFIMALFLAGLRSVDQEIIKAAQVDGFPTHRIYLNIVIPLLTPVFLSALVVLSHLAVKSFDLVIALTSGGPGYATDMPATYMYAQAFSRGDLGQAAASATIMLVTVCAIMIPYMYSQLRSRHD